MIRSEELIDGLVASLHFHNYLQLTSSSLYNSGPLNVVVTEKQKENIQDYIDDVFIDLFFRTHHFKPIIIPNGWPIRKFTEEGIIETKGCLELNLNNPYDRYSFISCISMSVMNNQAAFVKLFPDNRFISDIRVVEKRYGPIWSSPSFVTSMPYGDEFEQYLSFLWGMKHSKYNPEYRTNDMFDYSSLYFSRLRDRCYKGLGYFGLATIQKRQIGYKKIKDLHTFGEYTNEDIFMIFCLLVDKLKLEEDSFLSQIGIFSMESIGKECILNDFKKFEMDFCSADCIKPHLRDRDLFLRFTSASKSRAVNFNISKYGYADISFFEEKPIHTVVMNNSIPLPFLYNELYH